MPKLKTRNPGFDLLIGHYDWGRKKIGNGKLSDSVARRQQAYHCY